MNKRISTEKHIKIFQAYVNFRLAMSLINQNDDGGRIKDMAIKKEAKHTIKTKNKTDKDVCWPHHGVQVLWYTMVCGWKTSPKLHMCSQKHNSGDRIKQTEIKTEAKNSIEKPQN